MKYFYQFAGGKSVFFALVFLVCGIILAFTGKLNASYVGLAGGVQGLISIRSIMDDFHSREMEKINNTKAANG